MTSPKVQAAKTVLEYVDHLVECCLVDRLEKFAESPKARLLSQKKVYACDTGLLQIFENGTSANFGLKRGVVVTYAQNDLAVFDGCEIEIVAANDDAWGQTPSD